MLKIKVFPIEKYEDANKFLEKTAARTDKGLMITPDGKSIGIFFEEGEQSPAELIADLRVELAKKQRERQVSELSKKTSLKQLKMVVPQGLEGATDEELRDRFKQDGMIPEKAKYHIVGIANLRNELVMAMENIFKCDMDIEVLREMITDAEAEQAGKKPKGDDDRDEALMGRKVKGAKETIDQSKIKGKK